MMEEGYEVDLAVVEKTNWQKVLSIIPVELPKLPREYYLLKRLRCFGIYQRVIASLHVLYNWKKYDVTINTHGDLMITPCDIVYCHFPYFTLLENEPWRYASKYYSSLFWRMYFEPYRLVQKHLSQLMRESGILLTNSSFSHDVLLKYSNRKSLIVYPPIELKEYEALTSNVDREDIVVSIARFAYEKNLHLIPYIASIVKKAKFIIIGSVHGYESQRYYNYILELKRKLKVDNLEIYPNAPHKLKIDILRRSKVYLHLMMFEHLGLAPIEAMASGLIPVVHKSGGTWSDVVEYGKFGLGFEKLSPYEVAEVIEKALDLWNPKLLKKLSSKAKQFSDELFREKMKLIVKKVLR